MKIYLFVKNVYGSEMLYPCSNCPSWESLTGKKTFTREVCRSLKELGFELVVNDPKTGNPMSTETFFDNQQRR